MKAKTSHRLGVAPCLLASSLAACSAQPSPAQPSVAVPLATTFSLEAEAGRGDGRLVQRSHASGGQTVHLGPGEHRLWTFDLRVMPTQYAFAVSYSNGKEGPNEILSVAVDGTPLSTFQDRDSGDAVDGWNEFVTDPAGTMTLGAGSHTLRLEVSGGDGCVEIDLARLSPVAASTHQ